MIGVYGLVAVIILVVLLISYLILKNIKSTPFSLAFIPSVFVVVSWVMTATLVYQLIESKDINEYDVVIKHITKENVSLTYTANIKIANEDCATIATHDFKNKAYAQIGIAPLVNDTVIIKPKNNPVNQINPYDCVNTG